jgi:hypothetical protein
LHNELMRLALARVNWRRVAKALLRYYTIPVILASHVPDRRWPPRFAWAPVAWRGPVN